MDLLSILDGTPDPSIVALHLKEINTSGEYNLATPMFEFQRELTDQIVSLHYPDILKYCETDDTTELITKSLQICVENCLLVATHPYLLIRHYMPKNLALKELPAKLAETSGKFSVLKNIVNVVIANRSRSGPKNVAVLLTNDSRMFDLTEALLLGCSGHKAILRYVGNNFKKDLAKSVKAGANDPLTTYIHLIPSDGAVSRPDLHLESVKFDAFIAVDGSVDLQLPFLSKTRSQNRFPGQTPAALVKLVPMFSTEHCLVHYERQKHEKSYLYGLISSIVCLRDQIGNLPPDLHPIYNQNLSYLSRTFFDQALSEHHQTNFPAWPLPELCPIPSFSPSDVERSLLTELVYHHTPYDSSESGNAGSAQRRKTYYESKRLQLDYVTNPLCNDYNTLRGIHTHHTLVPNRTNGDTILTHLLLLQLNENHMELSLLKEEFDLYTAFNNAEKQKSFGRRLDEIKQSLASIMDDVDHSQQRVEVTQRKIAKRTRENEELTHTQKRLRTQVAESGSRPGVQTNPLHKQLIERQLKIWNLQHDVKALVATLKVQGDEKNYMRKEVASCTEAMAQCKTQILAVKLHIQEMQGTLELQKQENEKAEQAFQEQRETMLQKIAAAETEHEAAKNKLAKILAYLKETSHLKKRKGRGLTPNAR